MKPTAALVLALAMSAAACGSSDSAEPLTVAQEWLAAYETGDIDTMRSLMSPDATQLCSTCGYDRAESPYFASGGGFEPDTRDARLLALGDGTLNAVCEAEGATVMCATHRESDFGFFDEAGNPMQGDESAYEFTIEDGVIERFVVTRSGGNLFDFARIDAYEAWLGDTHPDAHSRLFSFGTVLLTTDEQFAEHATYVDEWRSAEGS